MHIAIWSDIICPFCYIGKTNLDTALREAGIEATIEHRAFRLMPGEAPYPVEQMFTKRYGQNEAQAQGSLRNVEAMAARSGLDFHLSGTLCGDTSDGHKLLLFAATKGLQPVLLDRLYRAYFTQSRNVFDREVLLELGEEAGLLHDDMLAAFDLAGLAAHIDTDQRQAAALNVRGVPFFVFDNKVAVSGAQPPQAFLQAFAAVASKEAPEDGLACGPDACEIP